MPRRLIFVTGAGLSADSGVQTFRTETEGGKALWAEYDLEEVCNIGAFQAGYRRRTCPDLPVIGGEDDVGYNLYNKTHDFYNKRRVELENIEPNAAHRLIARLYSEYGSDRILNITTNVDDLLERAGIVHEDVLHVHGYLPEVVVDRKFIREIGYADVDVDKYDHVKPNVVFFGESAPLYSDMYHMFDSLTSQDMVIVVGCSNQVINFNWELFPALNMGTKMVVVNPGLNYVEQTLYEDRGVFTYREKAAIAFSNEGFIKMVEDHLNK